MILSIELVPATRGGLLIFWVAHLNGILDPGAPRLLWSVVQHVIILLIIKLTIVVLLTVVIVVQVTFKFVVTIIRLRVNRNRRLARHHHRVHHRQAIFLRILGFLLAPSTFFFVHCLFLSAHVLILIDSAFLAVLFK